MKFIQRPYEAGDEVNINKLYRLITGRGRNIEEFCWEWIHTWNGQGSMWLAFDEDREQGDKLIMQYSLIPIPFSFWGKSFLAGKTENCMCHPDCRGKGEYFQHEKESFKEAKNQFDLFFTTAGDVTKGTVGVIRRKLGYVAFDAWTQYVFCLNPKYLRILVKSKLQQKNKIFLFLAKGLITVISHIFVLYFRLQISPRPVADIRLFNKHEAPLDEIEHFWNRNKSTYMITVDRHNSYLKWRINQNPYHDYKYLLYYKDDNLVGYAIYLINNKNSFVITDILAENRDMSIFSDIVTYLIWNGKDMAADAVTCGTLVNNEILHDLFSRKKFLNLYKLRKLTESKENTNAFHVYISPEINSRKNPLDPRNWYVTDLVKEGRTY